MLSLKVVKGGDRVDGASREARVPAGTLRFVIGRDPACDWTLPDRTLALSARHCEIVAGAAGPCLQDLSTNGTFVNGATARLSQPHRVHDGDQFLIGPYVVQLNWPDEASAGPWAAPDGLAPPPPTPSSVDDTTRMPLPASLRWRGDDPAVMAAMAASTGAADATSPVTAPAAEATDLMLELPQAGAEPTRIRPVPAKVAPAEAVDALSLHAPPVAGAAATPAAATTGDDGAAAAAPPGAPDALAELASLLGLSAAELAGASPEQVLQRLAGVARAALAGLQALQLQQSQMRRALGSRHLAELRYAGLPLAGRGADALQTLLLQGAEPAPLVERVAADLVAQQAHWMVAQRRAARRLGAELSPVSLAAAAGLDPPSAADKARLWDLYAALWQHLGLSGEEVAWPDGFVEAARLHFAAAYDGPDEAPGRAPAGPSQPPPVEGPGSR